jgi:hypothetical protein
MTFNTKQPIKWNIPADVAMPADTNQLAFYSIAQLSSLLRHHKITSVQLTQFYKPFEKATHCTVLSYGTNSNGTS